MPLSDKHVGPKIFAKIKIYNLIREELLFNLCYEIPCRRNVIGQKAKEIHSRKVKLLTIVYLVKMESNSNHFCCKIRFDTMVSFLVNLETRM